MHRSLEIASVLAITTVLGCREDVAARPQLVVLVDTDAQLVDELEARPEISPDAAIDTLRIDMIDRSGNSEPGRTFDVYTRDRLPLSFGVAGDPGERVTLRLRLFRARDAFTMDGLLTPFPENSVDRLVNAAIPQDGTENLAVMLSFDCLGRATEWEDGMSTCVDRDRPDVDPAQGIDQRRSGDKPASEAGTWADAIEQPCASPGDDERVCIPGGFTILGERIAAGKTEMQVEAPVPLRPVVISPFLMDRFEYTVGRFRRLVASNSFTEELPDLRDTTNSESPSAQCTWIGADDPTNDDLPLNCVLHEAAEEICALEGGRLPSEAEWEHAARGRGESRLYPWGNDRPRACCTLSFGLYVNGPCGPATGVEPVGSHSAETCDLVDVSRDGVQDLGGSLREATGDRFASYADPTTGCWDEPIEYDPRCAVGEELYARRGGYWSERDPATYALAMLRGLQYVADAWSGFRCVYPERTP
jgi:formylglycine-generating enzyme required for sulfatase activity